MMYFMLSTSGKRVNREEILPGREEEGRVVVGPWVAVVVLGCSSSGRVVVIVVG